MCMETQIGEYHQSDQFTLNHTFWPHFRHFESHHQGGAGHCVLLVSLHLYGYGEHGDIQCCHEDSRRFNFRRQSSAYSAGESVRKAPPS